ncbi:unnamed protein product, partial [marine sediment metagenome]
MAWSAGAATPTACGPGSDGFGSARLPVRPCEGKQCTSFTLKVLLCTGGRAAHAGLSILSGRADMNLRGVVSVLLTCGCALSLSCCTPYEARRTDLPPEFIPERFSQSGGIERHDRWWETFGDPGLNALLERALSDNLGLRRAWARLDQARALAKQAGADVWPRVSAEAGASRTRHVFP